MRVLVVPAVVFVALSMACPSGRTVGEGEGEGGEGEGEGEGQPITGPSCEVGGFELEVDGDGDVDDEAGVDAPAREDGAPLNLSCIGNPRVVGASTEVTLQGCMDIFGIGNNAERNILVEVFNDGDDPGTANPIATGTVATRDDAAGLDCAGADADAKACRAFDCDSRGYYRLDGTVPTHVPLLMKVAKSDNINIIPSYTYGLVFFEDDATAGVIDYDAALIFRSTWQSIPSLSGRQISGGQTVGDGEGNAVIAGELHDCDDVIIQNANVGITGFDGATMTRTYMDGDEEDPKPALARGASANDGLFVLLNLPTAPGSNTFTVFGGVRESCDGDDCTCQSLGSRVVRTFPDSVTIATLRGDFPVIQ